MKHKRTAAMLLAVVLLLTLCACGKGAAPDVTPAPEPSAESAETLNYDVPCAVTATNVYPFEGGWNIKDLARIGNTLLLAASQSGNYRAALADYTVSDDGTVSLSPVRELSIPDLTGRGMPYISCVSAGEDGCFYVVSAELPKAYFSDGALTTNDGYTGEYTICSFSPAGELLGTIELHDWENGGITRLAALSDGRLLVYSVDFFDMNNYAERNYYIAALSADGSVKAAETLDSGLFGSKAIGDKFYGMFASLDASNEYVAIDPDTAEVSPIAGQENLPHDCPISWIESCDEGSEWIVLIGSDFYSIDPAAGSAELVLSYDEFAQSSLRIDALSKLGDGLYAVANGGDALVLLRRAPIDSSGRQIVKVACCDAGFTANPAVLALNSTDDKYFYMMTETTKQELALRLTAGDVPDLVLMSSSYLDEAGDMVNTASNVFADLYPYLDADPELGRDSFLPNMLDGLTTNGELHALYNSTEIISLSALEKYVGDGKNLSIDDYRRIIAENDELAAMFGPWMTKSNLLGWICSTCINDYVDYANGTCDFNNDSFKALLEWCSEMNPDYEGEVMPEGYATYSEDEALLHLNDYMNIGTLANSMYPINVGFPSGAGNGSYYSCVYAMGMAIPAAAENKDGAWNFIRSQLVLQAQTWSEDAIASLPVNMEAMQRVIDAIAVNDPAQAARLTELLNGITTVISGSDVAIRETIIDCAKAYFNGDRSLDDTAAAIQDKLSLYMAERYGW